MGHLDGDGAPNSELRDLIGDQDFYTEILEATRDGATRSTVIKRIEERLGHQFLGQQSQIRWKVLDGVVEKR